MPLSPFRGTRVLALLLGAGVVAGVLLGARARTPGLLRELARETRGHGASGMRLSILSGFRPCGLDARDAAGPVCGAADGVPSRRTLSVLRRIDGAARAGTDPEALHAAALSIMLFSASAGNQLDDAISYLQTASRLSERPAPVLADLAAAHLLHARASGSAWDLFQALEAAARALEHEPGHPAARFNAAAALERIGTQSEAARAWSHYLEIDSTSAWAAEARERKAALVPSPPPPAPPRSATRAELQAYAAAAPREARELGWDDLLREWGAAVLAGDSSTARARLVQVEVLGAALARPGGDATLADAAAAVRAQAASPAGLRRLAQAHAALGEGRRALLAADYAAACPRFRDARRAGRGALDEWARTFLAMCAMNAPAAGTLDELGRLAAAADSARHGALAGRRWLVLGSALYSRGRYDTAIAAFSRASTMLERAGEREYAAGARMQIGNARSALGDGEEGYAALQESLGVLRAYRGSLWLWNGLYSLRNALLADGLPRAAMHVQNEAVAVAEGMPPHFRAETRLARARLRLAVGERDIEGDVQAAVEIMKVVDEKYLKEWFHADLRQTRAEAWLPRYPARALPELDSVVNHFGAQPARLLPALFLRAHAELGLGLRDRAGADLRSAVTVLDSLRAYVGSAQLRASLLEQSRRVFDQAVMLSVRAGRMEEALEYLERSRSSFSPVDRPSDWAGRPFRVPRGEVAVAFALVGDTLLAWTLWNGGLRFAERTVSRAGLARDVERVRSALEMRSADAGVLGTLEALYDELIRPLRPWLGEPGTPLVIVADGELATLPMAALRDRERARYLVEDHPVRFASSLRDPVAAPSRPEARLPVTLVADPAFDRAAFPELQPLPGAVAEVEAIARRYDGERVLRGARAGAAAIRDGFLRGGITHFAGHAVFDDARPERSYLVVAREGGPDAPGRITAAEIERMDLRGLRLVVLSACQTARAQEGRSGGFAGLAGAFLAAGAGGVVGSLWRVDDQATRVLMEHFHAAWAGSGNPADALRQAQLRMLRSADPALRSPAAWAGFRYAGG